EPISLALGPSVFDDDVLAFDVAEVAQTRPQSLQAFCLRGGRIRGAPSEPIDLAGRLGHGEERRNGETEREHDREPDPPHGHLRNEWVAGGQSRTHTAP